MGKFKNVIVLEVEEAKDKHVSTAGGKYRKDTPWLVEAFKKKSVESDILFINDTDSPDTLCNSYPETAFLGRVNPMDYSCISLNTYIDILDGLNRKGVLLGPLPEHMDRLGSKMILYELRNSSIGVKGIELHKFEDMKTKSLNEIDRILPKNSEARVLKMMRGSTGLGVWKLENGDNNTIRLTDAYDQKTQDVERDKVLDLFCQLCQEDAICMPFLPLISEGEFRFLMSKNKVLEVVHKKPIDETAFTATLRSGAVYTILDLNEHKRMVDAVEKWSNDIKEILKMDDVPYWWSVDCIEEEGCGPDHKPSSNQGRRLVLSEINCSCLGLVADTSEEAKQKGMRFADMIADICLA